MNETLYDTDAMSVLHRAHLYNAIYLRTSGLWNSVLLLPAFW